MWRADLASRVASGNRTDAEKDPGLPPEADAFNIRNGWEADERHDRAGEHHRCPHPLFLLRFTGKRGRSSHVYRCPAGALLPRHMTTVEKGMTLHRYWDRASCTGCSLKSQCTPSIERRVTRWEHEAVIDALQGARMDLAPRAMRTRRRLVEHPFGTIKAWMGHTHFLMKRLPNVKTEISLHILAYNMKRVMAVLGTKPLMEAIRA